MRDTITDAIRAWFVRAQAKATLILLACGALLGLVASEMAHAVQRDAALAEVAPATDSAKIVEALRVPMEAREDSLRSVVAAQAEALRAGSVRSAEELERADRRARRATVRASSLADSVRVRVDSATAVFLDAHLAEDLVGDVALKRQVEILRSENVVLWGSVRTLEELVAAGADVEASLRAELALKNSIIESQARALDPPFSLRLVGAATKVVPAFLAGLGLGVVAGG